MNKTIFLIGAGKVGSFIAYHCLKKGYNIYLHDSDENTINIKEGIYQEEIKKGKVFIVKDASKNNLIRICSTVSAVVLAISWEQSRILLSHLLLNRIAPIIVAGRPDENDTIYKEIKAKNIPGLLGVGLEPGLMEAYSKRILEVNSELDSLFISCGGVSLPPPKGLGYRISFGTKLPIKMRKTRMVKSKEIIEFDRFSMHEELTIPDIGTLEAFDDAMLLSTGENFRTYLNNFRQTTLRWPGYSSVALTCNKLGLLKDTEIILEGKKYEVSDLFSKIISQITNEVERNDVRELIICSWSYNVKDTSSKEILLFEDEKLGIALMPYLTAKYAFLALEKCFRNAPTRLILPYDAYMQDVMQEFIDFTIKTGTAKYYLNDQVSY